MSRPPIGMADDTARPLPAPVVALLSESCGAVFVVDEPGTVVFANGWASALFQRPVDDLVGEVALALVVPDDEPRMAATLEALQGRSETPYGPQLSLRVNRADGARPTVDLTVSRLDAGDGSRWAVVAMHDVSARAEAEQRVAHLNRAYLMLAQLNQAVIDSRDAASLFTSTTRICAEQGGFLGSSVAVPTPDGQVRMIATAGDVEQFVSSLVITLDPLDPHGRGPTGRVLRDGQPCFVPDLVESDATAPWHDVAVRHGVGAVVALPLRTAGRVVASLSIYADRAAAFDEGVNELLLQVADNVSHALDGYAAEHALLAEVEARHALLGRLVNAEENERARIAAGIHDDSVQTMAAVELRLGLLLRTLDRSPELGDCAAMVRHLSSTVAAASNSLRHLLFELEPPLLAQPLEDALHTVAQHVFEGEATTWSVTGARAATLAEAPRAQALRIVKEALINVRKHAGARHVDIEVRCAGTGVELTVTDDGVGLDDAGPAAGPPALRDVGREPPTGVGAGLTRPGHRGLSTMRDRASAAGGWLHLESAPTGGTRLRVVLPSSLSA